LRFFCDTPADVQQRASGKVLLKEAQWVR